MPGKENAGWKRRGRTTWIRRRLARILDEIQLRRVPDTRSASAAPEARHAAQAPRRQGDFNRLRQCPGLTEWLRGLLADGLDARGRQHFGLQPGTPLVPIDEADGGFPPSGVGSSGGSSEWYGEVRAPSTVQIVAPCGNRGSRTEARGGRMACQGRGGG